MLALLEVTDFWVFLFLGNEDLLEGRSREILRVIFDLLLIHFEMLHELDVRFQESILLLKDILEILTQEIKLSPLCKPEKKYT